MCLDSHAVRRRLFGLGSAVLENPEPCGQLHWPDNAIKLALPFQMHKPQMIRASQAGRLTMAVGVTYGSHGTEQGQSPVRKAKGRSGRMEVL